jgi:hypothetical protein
MHMMCSFYWRSYKGKPQHELWAWTGHKSKILSSRSSGELRGDVVW